MLMFQLCPPPPAFCIHTVALMCDYLVYETESDTNDSMYLVVV